VISIDERIRYGLPIDDESRRLLLRLEWFYVTYSKL
jgi:hypothetical protein